MICTHYTPDHGPSATRCTREATHKLIQPDGRPNPGSRLCAKHGAAVVTEYLAKLNEQWRLVRIDDLGNEIKESAS